MRRQTLGPLPALEVEAAAEQAQDGDDGGEKDGEDDDETPAASETGDGVSFHQRAVPLLDMLERALKDAVPVTWGV